MQLLHFSLNWSFLIIDIKLSEVCLKFEHSFKSFFNISSICWIAVILMVEYCWVIIQCKSVSKAWSHKNKKYGVIEKVRVCFEHEVRFLSAIHFEVDFEIITWNTYFNNKTSSYQQNLLLSFKGFLILSNDFVILMVRWWTMMQLDRSYDLVGLMMWFLSSLVDL